MDRSGRTREVVDVVRRGEDLLDAVVVRSRSDARTRWDRLRGAAPLIAQSAVAAGGAWYVAGLLAGDGRVPFFAPIAAVISLGSAFGRRIRRTVELVLGVALGIGVADALMHVVGHGPVQLVGIVALAMTVAVLVDGGQLAALQAGTSSVLVATLVPPEGTVGGLDRFFDALVGGGIGLAVALLLLPLDPLTMSRRHLDPVVAELAGALDDLADALETRDAGAAADALSRARATEPLLDALGTATAAAGEIARLAPARRGTRGRADAYADAAGHLDHAVRNARVLARRATVLLREDDGLPAELPAGVRLLARAVREAGPAVGSAEQPRQARARLVEAAALATAARAASLTPSAHMLVGQVRSIVFDLLLALGADGDEAAALLGDAPAAGLPPGSGAS